MPTFTERLQHGWNAFMGRDPTYTKIEYSYGSSYRPDRPRFTSGNERSIINSIYNRIANDVSEIDIKHVLVDLNGQYIEDIKSGLNNALTLDANEDQTGKAFIKDVVISMFDEGVVALVPTDTSLNPKVTGSYDIDKLRTGKVVEWYPGYVKVNVFNEKTARREDVVLPKKMVAIVENPFYSVMNEPNSTLKRLIRTLNQLDILNNQNSSGKLDLIIQLPYVVKNETKRQQAEIRRKEIEAQLIGSKYGIAYTDGTERITQLNRPVENNLWQQVKELTTMLYNQLGVTQSIIEGTAKEEDMINYYNHTINPILNAICDEMMRKFLTSNARTRGQAIKYFRDPFGLVPVSQIAEIADKFTRNEIATSNEIRSVIGWKPSMDPKADELRNSNLNQQNEEAPMMDPMAEQMPEEGYPAEPMAEGDMGSGSMEPDFSEEESALADIEAQLFELEELLNAK